jgi:hypothetical protein
VIEGYYCYKVIKGYTEIDEEKLKALAKEGIYRLREQSVEVDERMGQSAPCAAFFT